MAALLQPKTLSELMPPWRISVDRYHAMIASGILGPEDRVELLDGIIVEKMSKNPPHSYSNRAVRRALERLVPPGWLVDSQNPITVSTSEPEPDAMVIRGAESDFLERHPRANEVGLVVEVADASLRRDRLVKKRIYAAAGIPYYWLLDLTGRRLEVYSEPREGDYSRVDIYSADDQAPVVLDGVAVGSVAVSTLLP